MHTHSTTREPDARRRAGSVRPAAPHPVTTLQKAAGNRAVAALLASGQRLPVQRLPVQRYDTGEHAQMGSDEVVMVNGVPFTRAQLTTMGDFYPDAEHLMNAPPWELLSLKRDIEKQTRYYKHLPGGEDVSEGQWEKDKPGYLDLAEKNDTHFAPDSLPGHGDHKSEWERYHREALMVAHAAGRPGTSVPVPEKAKIINAFGNHFLTDAFSAGHLIPKADVVAEARRSFEGLADTDGIYFKQNVFTDRVGQLLMADPKARAAFDRYFLVLVEAGEIDAERLSELLWQMSQREPGKFYGTIIKAVHDQANRALRDAPQTAIEVENRMGDRWLLSGDTTLARSPHTLAVIDNAIKQSEINLEVATARDDGAGALAADGFTAQIPRLLDSVWAYTPHPTALGQKRLDAMRSSATDTAGVTAASKFAKVILDNLDDVIDGLVKRKVLVNKDEARMRFQGPGKYMWR